MMAGRRSLVALRLALLVAACALVTPWCVQRLLGDPWTSQNGASSRQSTQLTLPPRLLPPPPRACRSAAARLLVAAPVPTVEAAFGVGGASAYTGAFGSFLGGAPGEALAPAALGGRRALRGV